MSIYDLIDSGTTFSGLDDNVLNNTNEINSINEKFKDYSSESIEKSEAKIVASDAEYFDRFGDSVSINGDYAIVGAPYEDSGGGEAGAAYIFHKTGENTWDAGIKITASDAETDDNFGSSVSISGDYCIVGAYYEDTGGSAAGAAYIFHRTGTNTWDTGTKIVASDAEASDKFGKFVSISGDYCIAGAYGEDTEASSAGAAYIFHRTGTNTWDAGTKIVAPDAQADYNFGISVSISGDYCIAGAYGESSSGIGSGAAYIFHRTGTNTWDTGTKIVASDAEADDNFGWTVSIFGDYCIVGSPNEDAEASDAGAAYIFHRTGVNTWDAGTKIVAPDAETHDHFGKIVSINGDYIIVGAYGKDTGGNDSGSAYIFHKTGENSWDVGIKIMASDAEADDRFGWNVSISGNYCIVGAYHGDAEENDTGAAYIYQIEKTFDVKQIKAEANNNKTTFEKNHEFLMHLVKDSETKIIANDAEADDNFGDIISIDGDYCIVGASGEDGGSSQEGAAYIYHRTGFNYWNTGTKIVAGNIAGDNKFGTSVSISGDYCVAGVPFDDAGGYNESGSAYIFHRTGTNTWDAGYQIIATDMGVSDWFGMSASISGDYCIVSSIRKSSDAGAAYIYHRTGTNTWDTGIKIVASDAESGDGFGTSVSIFGDYCIVGSPNEDASGIDQAGSAYIFHRTGTNTWDAGTKIMASDAEAYDQFGKSVSISGDYCIVGASGEDTGGSAAGSAYIFHRTGTNTWDAGTKIIAPDAQTDDFFGKSVSISGDYCIAGAYGEDTGASYAGAAYIFHRTGLNSWDAGTKIQSSDIEASDWFGKAVSISGDYCTIGAYGEDSAASNAGAAYIYKLP